MEYKTAKEVIELMVKINGELNNSLFLVETSSDVKSYDIYKTAVANIMGEILIEILNPIFREHPDLFPDGMK